MVGFSGHKSNDLQTLTVSIQPAQLLVEKNSRL